MGRFLCNTLQEAIASTQVTVGGQTRGFDVIVIGGGTFGSVMAHKLFMADKWRSRRILVLEQGPFVLPEHQQNLPFGGGTPNFVIPWVPDVSLNPALNFAGLLYAIGGRSLAWGGWSPELLHSAQDDEMKGWPAATITALRDGGYFLDASEQLGVSWTNDFIYGPLHEAIRRRVFEAYGTATPPVNTMKFSQLPDHPGVRAYQRKKGGALPPDDDLRGWLGLPASSTMTSGQMRDLLKLEAPLAVQTVTDPGQFPINKFSAIPLLIKASRASSAEADGVGPEADARKRVFVVGGVHVQELITQTQPDNWVRVTGVRVIDRGGVAVDVPLSTPDNGQGIVVIALGTIESTRLALTTFKDSLAGRAAQRMGRNLMAHLRSNLTIRVPREALAIIAPADLTSLQVSALFVKGRADIAGVPRYFHLQITASGLTKLGNDSETELFKKIPDIDQLHNMQQSTDTHVVITIRGIGEMTPGNPDSRIELATTPSDSDFGRPKAYVTLGNAAKPSAGASQQTLNDSLLWTAMDNTSDEIAVLFANKMPFEILGAPGGRTIAILANATAADVASRFPHVGRRDFLGTTHHEAGTLRMSDQAADGVTNDFGRVHDTTNCYVAGPALFPTIGSPNPMLTGVGLCRRTSDMLTASVLPKPPVSADPDANVVLFDGTGKTFSQWVRVSPNDANGFALINGDIVTYGSGDFGLLYYAFRAFTDFTLRLQFRVFDSNANSGVFIRFRDPLRDPTPVIAARMAAAGDDKRPNRAWTAVHSGFEVQIDDRSRGDVTKDFFGVRPEPDGLRKNRTGAIYKIPAKDPLPGGGFDLELQKYTPGPNLIPMQWYEYEIKVAGQHFTAGLRKDGDAVFTSITDFINTDPDRGLAVDDSGQPCGFIGLQSYPNSPVAFRHIRVKA
jgi:hypothetical protein